MTNDYTQMSRIETRKINEDVLFGAGFIRKGNSSLFQKGERLFVLSPGIGKGKHNKYWFDIREANLQKIAKLPGVDAWVLLRIEPSRFAFFSLARIQEYMKKETQEVRAHSGKVWGFYCDLDDQNHTIRVFSKKQEAASFVTELLDRVGAEKVLNEIKT